MSSMQSTSFSQNAAISTGHQYLLKILLLGDSGVGKSALLKRWCDGVWENTWTATIGIDFKVKTVDINGSHVKVQIWDTSGLERFRTVISQYYRGSEGILLVYDITQSDSFTNIVRWDADLIKHGHPDVKKIVLGMKSDLQESRKVTTEQGSGLAGRLGAKFMEVSAANGEGLDKAFISLVKDIIAVKYPNIQPDEDGTHHDHGNSTGFNNLHRQMYQYHPAVMQNFLSQMQGHEVVDVKIYAFSRHDNALGANCPLAVFTSCRLLESRCDYFKTMLKYSSFKEGNIVQLDTPSSEKATDHYDYSSDSDLGDDDDEEGEDLLKDFSRTAGAIATRVSGAWTNLRSTISSDAKTPLVEDTSDHDRNPVQSNRMGRIIQLNDVAYVTLRAFILYLYTSQITFAPLYGRRKVRVEPQIKALEPPSARSIYRLADKLGVRDLAELAKSHIKLHLTKQKIIEELFKPFTSRYPEILQLELEFFKKHRESLKQSQTWTDTIRAISQGEMPHSEAILLKIMTM